MLTINDISNGDFIVVDADPFQVLSLKHLHMGRGGSSAALKIKNLRTGQVLDRNYKPADAFEEANVEKVKVRFIYGNRGEFWFSEPDKPQTRFALNAELIGDMGKFLKANIDVIALKFGEKIINVTLPIKIDYKVIEAAPAVRGDTAQGGTKRVTVESGAEIMVPLFINEGDIIRVNTESGEYVERVEKA